MPILHRMTLSPTNMQVNTALCCLFSAVSIFLVRRAGAISLILSIIVVLLGSLALVKFCFNYQLGLDTLFISSMVAELRTMMAPENQTTS